LPVRQWRLQLSRMHLTTANWGMPRLAHLLVVLDLPFDLLRKPELWLLPRVRGRG
jgi:hypothetical protein